MYIQKIHTEISTWKLIFRGYFNVLLTVHHSNVINITNLILTLLLLSLSLLFRFKASTCFGHHLPIFRRRFTNSVLVSVV
jgi:hypothetical protein